MLFPSHRKPRYAVFDRRTDRLKYPVFYHSYEEALKDSWIESDPNNEKFDIRKVWWYDEVPNLR